MVFGHPIMFWVAVVGAALLRLLLSPWEGLIRATVSFVAAFFIGITFTDSVLAFFHMDPNVYKVAIGALVTLTGESIVRALLNMISSPTKVAELIRLILSRGTSK